MLSFDYNLSSAGVYFISLSASTTGNITNVSGANATLLPPSNPTLARPWKIIVIPGTSHPNRSVITGSGVQRARLSEVARARIEDRDAHGNLRVGEPVSFEAAASLTVAGGAGALSIPVSVTPVVMCAVGTPCVASGVYELAYTVPAPEACGLVPGGCVLPGDQTGDMLLVVSLAKTDVLRVGVRVDFLVPAYTPGYAQVQVVLPISITAGSSYEVKVQPRDALGPKVPSFEKLSIVVEPDQPYTIRQDAHAYFLRVSITASGRYSVRVLDGLEDVSGSPFSISVVAASPDPNTVVIGGSGAVTAFIGELTTFAVYLRDPFGNVIEESQSRTSSNAFLSHELGLQDTQAFASSGGVGEVLAYTPRFTGVYSLLVTINGAPARGAVIEANGRHLADGTSTVTVYADGASASLSSFDGPAGFTSATAGVPISLTITARDEYGAGRTVWGDAFQVTLSYSGNRPAPAPIECGIADVVYGLVKAEVDRANKGLGVRLRPGCMIGCSLPFPTYIATCMPTRSGSYVLSVTSGGAHVGVSPLQAYVNAGVLSHNTTSLLQVNPRLSWLTINLIQTSSTANLVEGAYLLSVGTIRFRIVALDEFGNRVPVRVVSLSSFPGCCEPLFFSSRVLSARVQFHPKAALPAPPQRVLSSAACSTPTAHTRRWVLTPTGLNRPPLSPPLQARMRLDGVGARHDLRARIVKQVALAKSDGSYMIYPEGSPDTVVGNTTSQPGGGAAPTSNGTNATSPVAFASNHKP